MGIFPQKKLYFCYVNFGYCARCVFVATKTTSPSAARVGFRTPFGRTFGVIDMDAKQEYFRIQVSLGKAADTACDSLVISIDELCSDFIKGLYSRLPEWDHFDVFSVEEEKMLCRITNTAYLRKTEKLSVFGLRLSIKKFQAGDRKEIRDKRVVVRFSNSELETISRLLKKSNQRSLSEFVRMLSLDSSSRFMSPEQAADLKASVRLLSNIANNLNQVAFKLNSFKQGEPYGYLERQIDDSIRAIDELKKILAKIRLT